MEGDGTASIKCQDLLASRTLSHCGWLRRRTKQSEAAKGNKPMQFIASLKKALKVDWIHAYVVLDNGCVYFFKDEKSQRPGKTKSLCGYNRVLRAGEVSQSEATWVFKIQHCHSSVSTTYFSSPSEREMKMWMTGFKTEMEKANQKAMGCEVSVARSISELLDGASNVDYYEMVEKELFPSEKPPDVPKRKDSMEGSDDDYDCLREDDNRIPPLPLTTKPNTDKPRRSLPNLPKFALPGMEKGNKPFLKKSFSMPEPEPKPKPRKKQKQTSLHSKSGRPTGNLGERGEGDGDAYIDIPHSEVSPKDEDTERAAFWEGVYWYGKEKEEANQIIRSIGKIGAYLVRTHPETREMVLVVYLNVPTKYKVNKNHKGYHLEEGTEFETVEEMLCFYYENCLPKANHKLNKSYKEFEK